MITCNGGIRQSGGTGASEGAVLCLGVGAMAPGMAITDAARLIRARDRLFPGGEAIQPRDRGCAGAPRTRARSSAAGRRRQPGGLPEARVRGRPPIGRPHEPGTPGAGLGAASHDRTTLPASARDVLPAAARRATRRQPEEVVGEESQVVPVRSGSGAAPGRRPRIRMMSSSDSDMPSTHSDAGRATWDGRRGRTVAGSSPASSILSACDHEIPAASARPT